MTPFSTLATPTSTLAQYLALRHAQTQHNAFHHMLNRDNSAPSNVPTTSPPPHMPYTLDVAEMEHILHTMGFHVPVVRLDTSTTVMTTADSASVRSNTVPANRSGLHAIIAAIEADDHFFLVMRHARFTLRDLVVFAPEIALESCAKPLFVIFQMLSALQNLHQRGITHGHLSSSSVVIDQDLFVTLAGVGAVAAPGVDVSALTVPRPLPPAAQSMRALARQWSVQVPPCDC